MGRTSIDRVTKGQSLEYKTTVGKYQPIYYAGASGDFNPIHIDNEFGKMAGLGGAILQGLCTMAFVQKTAIDFAGGDPGALKRIKVRFAKPVYPGDEISVKGEVTKMDGKGITAELEAVNQDGTEVITRAFAELELE